MLKLLPKFAITAFISGLFLFFQPLVLAQKAKKLNIVHADDLIFDDSKGVKAKRLIGNVVFKQENTMMYCDSAYFYSETNSMKAFSRVRIEEGDSLSILGDQLDYDGNTKFAKMRGNITMRDKNMKLTTNNLDYNRTENFTYYFGGGHIVNQKEKMDLKSTIGYYFPKTKFFHFKGNVNLKTDDYQILSDTLHHSNELNVTYFYGPTTIITSDSSIIYCEKGFFDKTNEISRFVKNAKITNEGQIIAADSIDYNQKTDEGKMFGNVEIQDTTENIIVKGDRGFQNQKDSTSLVVGNTLLIQVYKSDSLFLHADTLFAEYDSTRKHRMIYAYRHAKFLKGTMAGACDSLVFSNRDSLIKMYYNPIIWADENQLTAKFMQIKNYNGKIHWLEMQDYAFITSEEDSVKFNQISGKHMMNFFKDSELHKIVVTGRGQTIYYAKQDDGEAIGVNTADCENLIIYLDSSKINQILFLNKPKAILFPLDEVDHKNLRLDGFKWFINQKPLKPEDVFIWHTEN